MKNKEERGARTTLNQLQTLGPVLLTGCLAAGHAHALLKKGAQVEVVDGGDVYANDGDPATLVIATTQSAAP